MKRKEKLSKVVIAGGTGFIGQNIAADLSGDYDEVIILTRSFQDDYRNVKHILWDGFHHGSWAHCLEGAEAVINLCGRTVNCRYNAKNKNEILQSRINSTLAIGAACLTCDNPPKVWINSSSSTIYDHTYQVVNDESSRNLGDGFSEEVCKKWEQTFEEIPVPGIRKIVLRTAFVLGKEGGVMPQFLSLANMGFGGKAGNGNQYISWIHVKDYCSLIRFILDNNQLSGIVNAAAPVPVRYKHFMRTLRQAFKIPVAFNLPQWMIELGSWMIKTEPELILKSRKVVSRKLKVYGFKFQHERIESAFQQIAHQ